MNQVLSLSWSTVEVTTPPASAPVEQLSNEELVVRCQRGLQPERTAFAELMRRNQSYVERFLCHLAPDWQDRADIAQEVWIRVYRKIQHLQEPAKFRGWLKTITTNLFYDELRKRKRARYTVSLDAPLRFQDVELDWELPSTLPNPDEKLSTQEFYSQLQQAIAELPEVFRTAIVLREIQGMAYEEIAELTQVTLGTVKSRIARGRQRLQDQLQAYLDI